MVLLPAAAAVAGSSGFSPPLKARKRPQKNRGRGGGTGGRGGSTAPRLPVQVWDLLHGGEEDVASRIPEKVVADASQADAAATNDVEDDCAASALILSPNNEERQVMAGIAKDHSPTDDVIYHSDAVKSAVMDSHAVVLDDCNRILMDRKAAAADVEDDCDFVSPPPPSFAAGPPDGDADVGASSCCSGSASQRAADASSINRLAQGVADDFSREQSVYLGPANSAGKGAGDADIEARFGLCVAVRTEVDLIVSQHASETGGHWEVHGGGSQTCVMFTHKGEGSAFRASSNNARHQMNKRKVLLPCHCINPNFVLL